MPTPSSRTIDLSLTCAEQWTLHHVLLDRIERERTAADATGIDPPPPEVYAAFDTLEASDTRFTAAELEAMRTVLGQYHHRPDWCADRDCLEQLLHTLTRALEQNRCLLDCGVADD